MATTQRLLATILVVTLLTTALTPTAVATPTESPPEAPLDSNVLFWQGTVIVAHQYAPNASEASLYTKGGQHVRNISTQSDGTIRIQTSSLDGDYYVNAPGAEKTRFEILPENIRTTTPRVTIQGTPPHAVAILSIGSNRGGQTLHVSSSIPNFPSRVTDATKVDGNTANIGSGGAVTINLGGLNPGEYVLEITNANTGVDGYATITLNKTAHPPTNAGNAASVARGGDYWTPTPLHLNGVNASSIYKIEALDGSPVQHQLSTTQGSLYISTTDMDGGIYRVLTPNGSEVTRFQVNVQTLSASVSDDSLQLESNKGNYTALIEVSNSTGSVTDRVLDASVVNGTARITGVSSAAAIGLNTSALSGGDYSVFVSVAGTDASSGTTFTVDSSSSQSLEFESQNTTTTTTGTPTTQEPTVSETTREPTTNTTAPVTPGETSGGAPGFGILVGVLAVLGGVALGRQ